MIVFERKAGDFREALPIGNGRLGAMVYGGTDRESLVLNQDSMWYGAPRERVNPEAKKNLARVRELILSGQISQAQDLVRYSFSGAPSRQQGPYQMLGQAELEYHHIGKKISGYRRLLDLEEGMARESFRFAAGSGEYEMEKEYFASFPLGLLAIHIKTTAPEISLDALLVRGNFFEYAGRLDERTLCLEGTLGTGGVRFTAAMTAVADEGEVFVRGSYLTVRGTKEATLYLGCETSFYCENPRETLLERLSAAAGMSYEEVKRQHREDYRSLYTRVALSLEGEENAYAEEYFQFGRYLMICGSRPGSLALNLQGIWNDSLTPPWNSNYTININTEMNYWPAESCNLTECHMPLFDQLKRMLPRGQRTARKMYGCRGFVAHHNTDIGGDCAPNGTYIPGSYWVMGGAWLATHIWTHYLYTRDEDFLREMYPVLREAVLFFHDFLTEEEGELIVNPSVSPENMFYDETGEVVSLCAGAAMDHQILRELMEGYLKASRVLGVRDPETARTQEILSKLPRDRIGRHGQLMEWRRDYEEADPRHRHISHLYALCPAHQITPEKTPELAKAAGRTLERRLENGGGYTGWSCAWLVNCYARLGDGAKALECLEKLWSESTFPNRMDSHPMKGGPVFQIDGNLGATAGMAEMLVGADEERVTLLPALPDRWARGSVRGLRIPGNAEISLAWSGHSLENCTLKAYEDYEGEICYRGICRHAAVKKGESLTLTYQEGIL